MTHKVDSLLVTNKYNELLGIATLEEVEKNYTDENKTLANIVNTEYFSVETDTPYPEVAEIFAIGVTSIPVLQNRKLVGLITRSSMMRGLAGMKTAGTMEGDAVSE